ncbi:uncharacterized protein LOC134836849 [Culicoides brevitarsis]|uniref:uncharacterized protein LOC134836849 n=1 Tax=Culicoides brevitarsis TaxID=469753 RepID=UPI00307C6775
MEYLTLDQQLFVKQQKGENTDCSFVFKITTAEGIVTEKVIHGHKIVLSVASKYFETNFKAEWDGNKPILITSFDWILFDKLIRAIYLSEVTFETLDEAIDIYAAAHFYQIERVLELLRNAIQDYCLQKKILEISSLAKISWKCQDYKLMTFVVKCFCANTDKIIKNEDFMRFSIEVINWLFQYDDLSANENDLLKALEKYLETNKDVTKSMIKPATETVRFLSLEAEEIAKTTLLTQQERDFLLGKINVNFTNFTKNRIGRKIKSIFSQLPSEIQCALIEKISLDKCWVCKQYHSVLNCQAAKGKYPMYSRIHSFLQVNLLGHLSSKIDEYSPQNMIKILKEFQKVSTSPGFASFANIDELLKSSYVFHE